VSLREAVEVGGSIRGVQGALGARSCLDQLGGKQRGGVAEEELEQVNHEIDVLLEEYDANSASLDDRHLDTFDPLPEIQWERFIGIDCGGGCSTMVGHGVTDSMTKGLGAPEREPEMVQKLL